MIRKYSDDFKREAVDRVLKNGRRIKQTAFELGVKYYTLKEWVAKHDFEAERGPVPAGLTPEEECAFLRKQVALLKEDNDILKNFQAFLRQQPKNDIAL